MGADDNGDVYRIQHDWDDREALSTTLAMALEDLTECDVPLLIDTLDPEALNGLFRPVMYRTDRDEGFVEFPIAGYHIRIHADGEIVIRECNADGDADANVA